MEGLECWADEFVLGLELLTHEDILQEFLTGALRAINNIL
jgi:hypothetical protein